MIQISIDSTGLMAEIMKEVSRKRDGKRIANEAVKDALLTMGKHWHTVFRPLHFLRSGGKRYGYTPVMGDGNRKIIVHREYRTKEGQLRRVRKRLYWAEYAYRKKRQGHGTDPLVYSGETKRASGTPRYEVTSKRINVRYKLPNLNYRSRAGDGISIDKRAEFETVTEKEFEVLKVQANEAFGRFFEERFGTSREVTIIK